MFFNITKQKLFHDQNQIHLRKIDPHFYFLEKANKQKLKADSPYTTLYEYVHTYEGNSVDPTPNFTHF